MSHVFPAPRGYSSLNRGPIKAFVINLPLSGARRAHMLAQLSKTSLHYEFVPAVAGDTLTEDLVELAPTWDKHSALTPNILACALSHVLAYRRILETGDPAALILEDDTILPPNFAELAAEVAPLLTSAEVVLFHVYSPNPPCRLSRQGSLLLSSGHRLSYPIDLRNTQAAGAYMITAQACARIRESIPPVCAPADAWHYFYARQLIDRVRCVSPLPVSINVRFPSTIAHPPTNRRDALYQRLDRFRFPPVQLALALRRHRFYKRTSIVTVIDEPSPLAAQDHGQGAL